MKNSLGTKITYLFLKNIDKLTGEERSLITNILKLYFYPTVIINNIETFKKFSNRNEK